MNVQFGPAPHPRDVISALKLAKPAGFDETHLRFIQSFDSISKRERTILLREMMLHPETWFRVFLRWWYFGLSSPTREMFDVLETLSSFSFEPQEDEKDGIHTAINFTKEAKESIPMYLLDRILNHLSPEVVQHAYFMLGNIGPGSMQYVSTGYLLFAYKKSEYDDAAVVKRTPVAVYRTRPSSNPAPYPFTQLPPGLPCDEFRHEVTSWPAPAVTKTLEEKYAHVYEYITHLSFSSAAQNKASRSIMEVVQQFALWIKDGKFPRTIEKGNGKPTFADPWKKECLLKYIHQIDADEKRQPLIRAASFSDKFSFNVPNVDVTLEAKYPNIITEEKYASFSDLTDVQDFTLFESPECLLETKLDTDEVRIVQNIKQCFKITTPPPPNVKGKLNTNFFNNNGNQPKPPTSVEWHDGPTRQIAFVPLMANVKPFVTAFQIGADCTVCWKSLNSKQITSIVVAAHYAGCKNLNFMGDTATIEPLVKTAMAKITKSDDIDTIDKALKIK